MNKIDLFLEGNVDLPYNKISKDFIIDTSLKICEFLSLKNITISLIITDNEIIRQVNKDYRKKDYSTDVISFAYRENPFPQFEQDQPESLGDIYLSIEKAEEQSVEYKVTLKGEIKRLLVHSILHLIGYDHETSAEDEKIMQAKEDEIILFLESV